MLAGGRAGVTGIRDTAVPGSGWRDAAFARRWPMYLQDDSTAATRSSDNYPHPPADRVSLSPLAAESVMARPTS